MAQVRPFLSEFYIFLSINTYDYVFLLVKGNIYIRGIFIYLVIFDALLSYVGVAREI